MFLKKRYKTISNEIMNFKEKECVGTLRKSFTQGLASHFTVLRVNAKKTGKQYLQRIGETRARKLLFI